MESDFDFEHNYPEPDVINVLCIYCQKKNLYLQSPIKNNKKKKQINK